MTTTTTWTIFHGWICCSFLKVGDEKNIPFLMEQITQNPCRGSNCANVQDVEGSFLKHHPKLLHWNCKALNQRLTKKLYQLHRCEAQTFFEPRWRHGWEAQGGHHRCRPRWSHLSQNLTATATPGGGVAETPKNAWLVFIGIFWFVVYDIYITYYIYNIYIYTYIYICVCDMCV